MQKSRCLIIFEESIKSEETKKNYLLGLDKFRRWASVERELQLKKVRDSIDIVVNGKYAIEVKVPESRTTLRNLSAQLEEYKEEYPEICAVILDNEELNLYEDIKYYSERYKSKLDIDSVILSGKKRG